MRNKEEIKRIAILFFNKLYNKSNKAKSFKVVDKSKPVKISQTNKRSGESFNLPKVALRKQSNGKMIFSSDDSKERSNSRNKGSDVNSQKINCSSKGRFKKADISSSNISNHQLNK